MVLMDRISSLPGELFGGKTQELVTDKIDESYPSFEQTYGEDYVRVMKDITNNLDPKVKRVC